MKAVNKLKINFENISKKIFFYVIFCEVTECYICKQLTSLKR